MGQLQQHIDASVDWAINNLRGNVPDAAGNYAGECLSLIKQEYRHRTGEVAPSAGGYADGYLKLPGTLRNYFTVEKFDRHKSYPKGSYAVNVPTHHIMLYLGKTGDNASVYEQNADPNGSAAHIQTRDGAKIDWIMVPIVDAPPALPPAPVVHPYTIERIDPKQVQITTDTHKWGLNYDNYAAMQAHPEGSISTNAILTVQGILHHNLGSQYYLENPDVASGYNVKDCKDYVAPAPAPNTTPSAPVFIPSNTEPYGVIKKLQSYTTANNAINRINWGGTYVKAGTYMVFNRRTGTGGNLLAVNITSTQGVAGAWINVADNVPDRPEDVKAQITAARTPEKVAAAEVAPVAVVAAPVAVPAPVETEATIRNSIQWLQTDHEPVEFRIGQNTLITDRVHGGKPLEAAAGRMLNIYATFEQGSRVWALVRKGSDPDFYYMYGVPVRSHTDLSPLEDVFAFTEHLQYGFEKLITTVTRAIEGVFLRKR